METIRREFFNAKDLNFREKIPQSASSPATIFPIAVPPILVIPTEQHLGSPAEPVVEVDDKVLKGQLIAKAKGLVSANIHAPTSGTVVAVSRRPVAYDKVKRGMCIVLESDNEDKWIERHNISDFEQVDTQELINKIRCAGIVDMDGEGLPVHISLTPKKTIDTLIINACHWQNALNADDVLLLKAARELVIGIQIVKNILANPRKIIIALEDGKDAVAAAVEAELNRINLDAVEVNLFTELQAGPDRQQLIETATGKTLGHDGLAMTIGCVCFNVATVYAIYRAICLGEPAINQVLTINGDGFNRRQTLSVPIGTPVNFVLKQQGFNNAGIYRLWVNSTSTGQRLLRQEAPVNKMLSSVWSVEPLLQPDQERPKPSSYLDNLEFGASAEAAKVQTAKPDIPTVNDSGIEETDFDIENDMDYAIPTEKVVHDNASVEDRSEVKPDTDKNDMVEVEAALGNEAENSIPIEDDLAREDEVDAQALEIINNLQSDPNSTVRSRNIMRLQEQLKNAEQKLDETDPSQEESAEALLLSINVLIEKIRSAKLLREKENQVDSAMPANNSTLRGFISSLQTRLSGAQRALAKSAPAGNNTQSAVKQALVQLETRLEDALISIHTDDSPPTSIDASK